MADINQVITLGIGTPATVSHFILMGLNPFEVVFVVFAVVSGDVDWVESVVADVSRDTSLTFDVEIG